MSDLLLDEGHDANPGEDRLSTQSLPRHAVCKRLGAIGHRLAQVTHKERHVRPGKDEGEEKKHMVEKSDINGDNLFNFGSVLISV